MSPNKNNLVDHKTVVDFKSIGDLNQNLRAPNEYKLVTDGESLYRIHPNFPIPKGLKEVFTHFGKKVYQSNGKLHSKFMALQRVQPSYNVNKVTVAVREALSEID